MIQYYSKADRRAIILLSAVALICVLGVVLFGSQDTGETQETVRKADSERKRESLRQKQGDDNAVVTGQQADPTVSVFDPNTADSLTLIGTGLKPWQVRSFLRYRNAGALFREPMDIARVYCLDDADIDRLLPMVRIADRFKRRRTKYPIGKKKEENNSPDTGTNRGNSTSTETHQSGKFTSPTKVDVNTADTTLLQRIPGIGANIARWIVQRREKLGGFHSTAQLMEVKYVSEDMLEWFEVATDVRRRDLSEMTFSQMASFPYIGYEKAKAISNYTRLYGPFKDIGALRSSGIFTEEELTRLLPYLNFK